MRFKLVIISTGIVFSSMAILIVVSLQFTSGLRIKSDLHRLIVDKECASLVDGFLKPIKDGEVKVKLVSYNGSSSIKMLSSPVPNWIYEHESLDLAQEKRSSPFPRRNFNVGNLSPVLLEKQIHPKAEYKASNYSIMLINNVSGGDANFVQTTNENLVSSIVGYIGSGKTLYALVSESHKVYRISTSQNEMLEISTLKCGLSDNIVDVDGIAAPRTANENSSWSED